MLSVESYKSSDICEEKNANYKESEQHTRIFENDEYITDSDDDGDDVNKTEKGTDENNDVFESKEQMNDFIRKLCYGDLYVIGRIWIETLKTILVGAQLRLVPVVHAARPPPPPQKPPKMGYKDLPIYTSPHYDYKENEESKEVCPEYKTKIMHNYLLPYVKKYRTEAQGQLCKMTCKTKSTIRETGNCIQKSANDIKCYMRDNNNLQVRQACVGTGTLLGYLMGSNIPKKIFFAGLGGLSTGALCFPDETDEAFRTFMSHTGGVLIAFYNMWCGKNFSLRGRVPCPDDVPPEPPKRKPQCPKYNPKPKPPPKKCTKC